MFSLCTLRCRVPENIKLKLFGASYTLQRYSLIIDGGIEFNLLFGLYPEIKLGELGM